MKENILYLKLQHGISKVLHSYADWRIKPTDSEKHCYKKSDSILLTFDDYGPDESILSILETLKDKQVKAMFFIQGDWAEKNVDLVGKLYADGHIVGNHTYTHPDLLSLSDQDVVSEIRKGINGPWFRPPSGRYNARIRSLAKQESRSICYWTIDSGDWTGASVKSIRHTVQSELKAGSVILFHLHAKQTPGLLAELIDDIKSRGYGLTSFDEEWLPSE